MNLISLALLNSQATAMKIGDPIDPIDPISPFDWYNLPDIKAADF